MSGISMVRIRQEAAALPGNTKNRVPLTVAEPEGRPRGGIVLLHESRSFSPSLRQFMEEFAEEGWTVAAPALADEQSASDSGNALLQEFDAARGWLLGEEIYPDRIGVIGFDSAGTVAALAGVERPLGAVVSVAAHGITGPVREGVSPLTEAVRRLCVPWLGIFGDEDPRTPPEEVQLLRDAAAHASAATLIVTYPGLGHRPDEGLPAEPAEDVDDVPDTADASPRVAAVAAKQHIFEWFDSNLR